MRAFLLADLIARVATRSGLEVTLVQNITDVGHLNEDVALEGDAFASSPEDGEDKMLAQAAKEGRSPLDIARHYEALFHRDRELLNISQAQAYPRASEYIEKMVALISELVSKGHAYVGSDESVYFDARSFATYGAISGNRIAELKPGHRLSTEAMAESGKKFHADWALWKRSPATRSQLIWDSPWGKGFPGWHIECSAMSLDLLGERIDVHTGGIDLRFPHHEDERAQSNGASGHEVVNHWVHAEHLLFEGRKMSKSAENVVTISDVVANGFDPLALRLVFLEHRYRQQMDLSWTSISAAHETLKRWRDTIHESEPLADDRSFVAESKELEEMFHEDLDTHSVLVRLRALEKKWRLEPNRFASLLCSFDDLLGLDLSREQSSDAELPTEIEALAEERERARSTKDWKQSDQLRELIESAGYQVTDTPQGQRVRRR